MPSTPVSVLVFEHDEEQALQMKDALEREHYRVDVVQTGRAGLQRLLESPYDVYLIDLKLPDIQGVEVLRRINTIRPGAVAIIVTGHGNELAAVEAMKLGAYDYIIKLPHMGHLAALPLVIREGVARRHLKDERAQLQTELWEQARLLEERNAELRRANEELKRADQLKSDLVSMVGHELRTPLATIKAFTTILADQLAGPVTRAQEEYLGVIQANIDRLSRIIDDLLDLGKIQAGRVVLSKQVIDVQAMVDYVLRSVQPLAKTKQITLELSASPSVPTVFADPDKLIQVLLNLVSNAIKFTPGPGRVTISVSAQDHATGFRVTDTGIGIAPEDLPKLFGKFEQLQTIPSPGSSWGAGLGLAISKWFVELHGGEISATSQVGHGSAFSFTLPTYQPQEVFHEYLRTGIEQAKRKRSHFSVLVFAIPALQGVAAKAGETELSTLLTELERVLKGTVRRREGGDIVVRWPQGEMVAILAPVNTAGAGAMAARIRRVIEERAVVGESSSCTVPIVMATATYPEDGITEQELMSLIERRLQRSDAPTVRLMMVDEALTAGRFLNQRA